jgi:hypothetical protein
VIKKRGAFCLKERQILKFSLILGLFFLPILFRKPSFKIWSTIYLTNGIVSHLTDRALVAQKKLSYPVRLVPKLTKNSLVYDYIICPLISVAYCQATNHSKPLGILGKGILFALPQVAIEYLAERKTKLIRYKNGWTVLHSYIGILVVKLTFRGLFGLLKKSDVLMNRRSREMKREYKVQEQLDPASKRLETEENPECIIC